jgi:hypothetical protein
MRGCPYLEIVFSMDGDEYECEHPTYGINYGCDHCPMFGRNHGKRKYHLKPKDILPLTKSEQSLKISQ